MENELPPVDEKFESEAEIIQNFWERVDQSKNYDDFLETIRSVDNFSFPDGSLMTSEEMVEHLESVLSGEVPMGHAADDAKHILLNKLKEIRRNDPEIKADRTEKIVTDRLFRSLSKKHPELEALWEKGSEESREEFRKRLIALSPEFAVHGIINFESKEVDPDTDLDGRVAMGLFDHAGFNTKNTTFVAPGESNKPGELSEGIIVVDTGHKRGMQTAVNDKGILTVHLDHHGERSAPNDPSAARLTYLALSALGFFKEADMPTLDKLTEFVSQVDNASYPYKNRDEEKEFFMKSDRTVLGLHRFMTFENLYKFFKDGHSPEDILSPADLKKYGLKLGKKEKNEKKLLVDMIHKDEALDEDQRTKLKELNSGDGAVWQSKIIKRTKRDLEKLEKEGFVVDSDLGKIVVDVVDPINNGKVNLPSGIFGAKSFGGYDGYFLYNLEMRSFFLTVPGEDLRGLDLSPAKCIRRAMWIKPIGDKRELPPLQEILDKLGCTAAKGSKLEEYLIEEKVERVEAETFRTPN